MTRTVVVGLMMVAGIGAMPGQGKAPTLVPAVAVTEITLAPLNTIDPVRVADDGATWFTGDADATERLVLLDRTGRLVRRVGRDGSGPGEVRRGQAFGLDAKELFAFDLMQSRVAVWSRAGAPLRTVPLKAGTVPLVVLADGWLGLQLQQAQKTGAGVVRIDPATGTARAAIAAADTFVDAHFDAPGPTKVVFAPALGRWRGGFVVLDVGDYHMALYDHAGALVRVLRGPTVAPVLPAASRVDRQIARMKALMASAKRVPDFDKMRTTALATPLPIVALGSAVSLDADGRLWVFGQTPDGGFADVFTERGHLGRVTLPGCAGFEGKAMVSGRWLAASCAADAAADGDAVLRLYAIK